MRFRLLAPLKVYLLRMKEGKEAGLGKGGRVAARGCQQNNQTKLQGALKTR